MDPGGTNTPPDPKRNLAINNRHHPIPPSQPQSQLNMERNVNPI